MDMMQVNPTSYVQYCKKTIGRMTLCKGVVSGIVDGASERVVDSDVVKQALRHAVPALNLALDLRSLSTCMKQASTDNARR
mmetsp:Transcript_115432/g.337588  ORF Transcript_115432/g.337588 Transcript_115432/m.337588 type:complete len:81 (+) Transcript_115432:2231-2473(+)